MRFTLTVSIALITFFSSCDKDEPQILETDPTEMPPSVVEKRVMVELFSSIRCGSCPRAHHFMDQTEIQDPKVFHITHQMFGGNPMRHGYTKYVQENVKSVQFTPHAIIQRNVSDGAVQYYEPERYEEISTLIGDRDLVVELNATVKENDTALDIALDMLAFDDAIQKLSVTVLLVEKKVVGNDYDYHQRNYGNEAPDHPYYQQGDYIEGFEHTNVIRELITPFEGIEVDITNNEASYTLNHDLEGLAAENFALVAFVSDLNSNQIFDARYIDLADL